ncbi:MAG: ATP-binding cassette domain-containing protein [Paludibacteraceae bacterium]|nr:ATP-binding cassette domain-containing protein [Paludibacteraceae bacterium]
MATAIEFNHVGKQYRLGLVSTGTISHDLNRWWQTSILGKEDPYLKIGSVNDRTQKADSDYVWALRDIDFKVEQGDVVGIIGKNGAGKSTLLKLLSKVTGPTVGTIRARGRIASLLEVGTGFHQEMTGRENIYMNGAILGMTKREIAAKLDEIVDFSGCERYLDTPVKRYSSGMMVRLGFAVAAHLDPEILVVDEVLAVGDAEFQKKAIGKMQDVSKGEGRTVLFVSHNMASVQRLCHNGLLLENGAVKFAGNIGDTIATYLSDEIVQSEYVNPNPNVKDKLNLLWAKVTPVGGSLVYPSTPLNIEFRIRINEHVEHLVIGFNLYSSYQHPLARADYNDQNGVHTLSPGEYEFYFQIPANTLSNGEYYIMLDVAEKSVKNYVKDNAKLTFRVDIDENSNINTFSENIDIKNSIIREMWLQNYKQIL